MAVRDVESQVQAIIGQKVAQPKIRGAPAPNVEAAALFQSIALNLLLKPRTTLYIALLAKNGLLDSVTKELAAIDSITQTIKDLGNSSFAIKSTVELEQSKEALLQIEQLDKISTSSTPYTKFSNSIDEFLNNQVSKNVRLPAASTLTRPASEAAVDLPIDFQNLTSLHSDVLDRLYALDVGVDNFQASPISTVLGLSTSSRVRADIESIIDEIKVGGDVTAQNSRDYVVRLISGRSSIKSFGSLPNPFDLAADTGTRKPIGYSMTGTSDPSSAVINSGVGPFSLIQNGTLSVNGSSPVNFPQTTDINQQRPHLVGTIISNPVSIPASSSLFVDSIKNGIITHYKIDLSGSMTISAIASAISAATSGDIVAGEFVQNGTSRLAIWTQSTLITSISIAQQYVDPNGIPDPINFPSVSGTVLYTKSCHQVLGLTAGDVNTGPWDADDIVFALNILYSTVFAASSNSDGSFTIKSISTDPQTILTVSGTQSSHLTISTTAVPSSSSFRLHGLVQGVIVDPIDPTDFVDPGDSVISTTGSSIVGDLSTTRITMTSSLPSFDGPITITSGVVLAYQSLKSSLTQFLNTFLESDYKVSLAKVDMALAALGGSATPATINNALVVLVDLRSFISDLQTRLQDTDTVMPSKSGRREKVVLDGIIQSLNERKYDKAADLVMKCKLEDLISLTSETASYGGSLLKSAADVYKNDLVHPNRAKDEGVGATATQNRTI